MKIRAVLVALALALGVTGFAVVAGGAPASAATSCYGGARSITYDGIGIYDTKYTTSSRCRDINMRVAKGTVSACVIFVDHTNQCNYWTRVGTGWVTVATAVKDGTHFKLGIEGTDSQFGLKMYVAS